MKLPLLLAASALALTVAGCGNGPPKTRAALDCPAQKGDLRRTGAAADGRSCTYVSTEGAEVTLRLVSVEGGPDATLRAIESQIAPRAAAAAAEADAKGKEAKGQPPAAASPQSARDASAAEREAMQDAQASVSVSDDGSGQEHVHVAGGSIDIDEDQGATHVNLPGVHIDADDTNDTAVVDVGPIHVNAGGDGATIRIRRDVRLRGEMLSPNRRGVRATFIAERRDLPDGYHFVGYEAAGPKVGPLTVAIVKSKTTIDRGDRVYRAVRNLVRDNGGV